MSKRNLLLTLFMILAVSLAMPASYAAMTWKKLGASPFHRPPLKTEADLKSLVKQRDAG